MIWDDDDKLAVPALKTLLSQEPSKTLAFAEAAWNALLACPVNPNWWMALAEGAAEKAIAGYISPIFKTKLHIRLENNKKDAPNDEEPDETNNQEPDEIVKHLQPEERIEVDLAWARVVVAIYEYLAQTHHSYYFSLSAMFFKARVIALMGDTEVEYIGTSGNIVRWFHDNLTMTREQALSKIPKSREAFRQSRLKELWDMRQIKNRLTVLQVLIKANRLTPDEDLAAWLEIKEKLP